MRKRAARIVRDRRRDPRDRVRRIIGKPATSFEDGAVEELPELDTERTIAKGEP